jgi:hypothetical protein
MFCGHKNYSMRCCGRGETGVEARQAAPLLNLRENGYWYLTLQP